MQHRVFIAAFLLVAPMLVFGADVLDRLSATVNGHALLQSDVDEELRYESFAAKRPMSDTSAEDRKSALDRLIDQELLREQMASADFQRVSEEDLEKAVESFKTEYGAGKSWSESLVAYHVTEQTIKDHISTELNQLRLIDLRLRPSIQIDSGTIRDYYERQLLPKLPPGQHPGLQESTPTIRELLVQQKINESLDSWLESLRSQAKIQRFDEAGVQQK